MRALGPLLPPAGPRLPPAPAVFPFLCGLQGRAYHLQGQGLPPAGSMARPPTCRATPPASTRLLHCLSVSLPLLCPSRLAPTVPGAYSAHHAWRLAHHAWRLSFAHHARRLHQCQTSAPPGAYTAWRLHRRQAPSPLAPTSAPLFCPSHHAWLLHLSPSLCFDHYASRLVSFPPLALPCPPLPPHASPYPIMPPTQDGLLPSPLARLPPTSVAFALPCPICKPSIRLP